MKTDKEICNLPFDESLPAEERIEWYHRGYKQGKEWGAPNAPQHNTACSHDTGLIDGWNDTYPEQRLENLLKNKNYG